MNDLELYKTAMLANMTIKYEQDISKINFGQLMQELQNAKIIIRDELGVEVEIPFQNMELSTKSSEPYYEATIYGYGPIKVLYPQGVQSKWN